MKLYDGGAIVIVVIVVVCTVAGLASRFIFGPDNAIEQVAETVIEKETGMTIDLSPDSPAKR